jgi:LacI family transcriptional regulator
MLKTNGRRVTNRDVARLAGVSTAVVSYVLNDGPRPTSETVRGKVLKAAKALDYHPNAIARGLRSQKSHAVALIVGDYEPLDVFISPYHAGVLTGLIDGLKQHGYYLMVYPVGVHEDLTALQKLLRDGRLDGVVMRLVQDPPANQALLKLIGSVGLPCVSIERTAPNSKIPSVTIDEQTGGYEATRHLIAQGHKRIAHIHGDLRYLSARIRLERYKQALLDAGLKVDENLICGGTWEPADGAKAMTQLLKLKHPPTAVFAANDSLAFNALQVLRLHGVHVPDDMALIGFDDIAIARESIPPLTTMRIPLIEMGQQAAALILKAIHADGEHVTSVTVQTELIKRKTA